jgi:hypothetical protein
MLTETKRIQRLQREPHIAPAREAWIRQRYERIHSDDTFEDLLRRAAFSKHDAGLLAHWIKAANQAVEETLAGERCS